MTCECRKGSTCAEHLAEADLTLDARSSCEDRLRLLQAMYDELHASQARDRADFEARLDALVAERVAEAKIHAHALEEIVALREREQRLQEALAFYADTENYDSEGDGFDTPAQTDCGQIARAALAAGGEQP